MPHCQELKNQFAEIVKNFSKMRELLKEYKETGSRGVQKEIANQKGAIEESIKSLPKILQEAIDHLISHHRQAGEFEGKLEVQDGLVVCTHDILLNQQNIYVPAVIDKIEGTLKLSSITSAKNLELPDVVEINLWLDRLSSVEHLELPHKVGGNPFLNALTSAEHIDLPNIIGGNFHLENLRSAERLDFTEIDVGGNIYLDSLAPQEREEFKEEYPRLAGKITTI